MSIHNGHRQRMRDRFLADGLDGFSEHEVLEMLLYYCIARKDTNEIAHALINEFGSFARVLEAPIHELEKVPGMGHSAAVYLHFMSASSRYYRTNRVKHMKVLDSFEACTAVLDPYFDGRRNEAVFMLCLDAKCQLLGCKLVGEGSINSAGVPVRKIVEAALSTNASSVVLAHNHPSGIAIPSGDDVRTTQMIAEALRTVDVHLIDHLVFSDDECVSMCQSGLFRPQITLCDL